MNPAQIERILKRKSWGCQLALGLVIIPTDRNILMQCYADLLLIHELKGQIDVTILVNGDTGYLIVTSVD